MGEEGRKGNCIVLHLGTLCDRKMDTKRVRSKRRDNPMVENN